ncbi:F-box protein-like [Iris pallida]|uniref:F-box protein-like n=1 Tax=Iris pallida TaxID=29817 RepID=A0AAX6H5I2_IRIPA|nr:F-box protein-like [Iris pallida]
MVDMLSDDLARSWSDSRSDRSCASVASPKPGTASSPSWAAAITTGCLQQWSDTYNSITTPPSSPETVGGAVTAATL